MRTKVKFVVRIKWIIVTLSILIINGLPVSGESNDFQTTVGLTGLRTKYPQQLELEAFKRHTGKKMVFSQNPFFGENELYKDLPPVAERLPKEPLVVIPGHEIGKYGGTLNGMALSYESGTSEILSWRQANFVRFSDDNRTIVPNVARAWKWSKDYKQITFFLRKGHRWSDGAHFTADDVVFYLNDIILNRDIHPQAPAPWVNFNTRVEKVNDTTVRFDFSKPFPAMLFYLGGSGSYYDPFAPKHFLKQFHIKYNRDADIQARKAGYKNWEAHFKAHWHKWKDAIVSRAEGLNVPTLESHVLVEVPNKKQRLFAVNPYYFKVDTAGNQLPYITFHRERFVPKHRWVDEIIAGNVDQKSQNMSLSAYPELQKNQDAGNYTLQKPITGLGPVLVFNKTHKNMIKRKVFADNRFNWAVSLAINREKINKSLFLGLCRPGQALPQHVGFITDEQTQFMTDYDPDRANAFLDGLGLIQKKNGFRLGPDQKIFTIYWEYTLQYVLSHDLPKMIQNDLKAIGLNMVLKEVTTKKAREKQVANDLDISNEWVAPFEPTLFATPIIFMPPYGIAYPVMGIPWWEWKKTGGNKGEKPPLWVKNLWEIGEEFRTLVPGSDWYDSLGKKMVDLNLSNLSLIGTVMDVPLITTVSNKLGNVPRWDVSSYSYGYAYPYRADQWFFKE